MAIQNKIKPITLCMFSSGYWDVIKEYAEKLLRFVNFQKKVPFLEKMRYTKIGISLKGIFRKKEGVL